MALSGSLHRRFDKKPSLILACVVSGFVAPAAVVLRLMALLPANGEPALLYIVSGLLSVVGATAGIGYTSAGSMMADVAYDQFRRTGRNQQGILFSAIALSGKLGSAGGHFIAGTGIDLIQFPLQSEPGEVAPYLIARLGMLSLVSTPLVAAGVVALWRYRLTRGSNEAPGESAAVAG